MSDSHDKKPPRGPRVPRKGGDVGQALRKVYDKALNEDIPPQMLDLLGRLD